MHAAFLAVKKVTSTHANNPGHQTYWFRDTILLFYSTVRTVHMWYVLQYIQVQNSKKAKKQLYTFVYVELWQVFANEKQHNVLFPRKTNLWCGILYDTVSACVPKTNNYCFFTCLYNQTFHPKKHMTTFSFLWTKYIWEHTVRLLLQIIGREGGSQSI